MPAGELSRLTRLLRHCEMPVLPQVPEAPDCFAAIPRAVASSNLVRLRLHLNELFVLLLEALSHPSRKLRPQLTTACRTVEMFLREELPRRLDHPWTADQMADACALGRTRFVHHV